MPEEEYFERKKAKGMDVFAHLRSAENALAMLAKSGDTSNVSLCVLCIHEGKTSCPYRPLCDSCQNEGKASCSHIVVKTNKKGHCVSYKLDETDPQALDTRYMSALMGLSH